MSHTIYFNFIIKATKQKVYKAISEPEHLENWWPLKCTGIPAIGEVYNFNFTDTYDWYAQVIDCEGPNYIHYKMTKSDKDWDPTSFGFVLESKDDATYVRFFHKDWPEQNDHYKFSSFCWAMLLNGLKNYVERGIIIPFEERE